MDPNANPTPPVDPTTPVVPPVTPAPVMPAVPATAAPVPAAMPGAPVAGMPVSTDEAPRGWNWGAFWLTWIWGASHGVWISFLAFVPFVGIAMPFVLGAKGNEWAWKNNNGKQTLEQFKASQHKWGKVGFIIALVAIVLSVIGIGLLVVLIGTVAVQAHATANSFMVDLQNNDASDAYKLTSPTFQSTNSADDFATTVAQIAPNIKGTDVIKEVSVNVNNGVGTGEFDATVAGHTFVLSLIKPKGGSWLVDSVRVQ